MVRHPDIFRNLIVTKYGARDLIRTEGRDTFRIVGGDLDGIVFTYEFLYTMLESERNFVSGMKALLNGAAMAKAERENHPVYGEDARIDDGLTPTTRVTFAPGWSDLQRFDSTFWRSYRPTERQIQVAQPKPKKPEKPSLDVPVVPKRKFT